MIGALTFSLLWIATKFLFVTYSTYATVYAHLYGSLLEVILLLLWVYYSAALLLIGAEVAHYLQQRAQVWSESNTESHSVGWSLWFNWIFRSNETNQIDQINQIEQFCLSASGLLLAGTSLRG
jgi:hypothetical protein